MIDDDKKLCRLVADYLEPMSYTVETVHTGPAGVEAALAGNYDAVILDVMLPGLDGFEVLKQIRAGSDVPLLMLTGRGEEADRIVGLEIGADDYLPKTFSSRELLARLRAVTRRRARREAESAVDARTLEVSGLRLDLDTRTGSVDGVVLELTPVEFDLLVALASPAGRVRSREQLIEDIRDRHYDVYDRSVDVHISALRKKLHDDPKEPRFIQTVRSAGYLLRRSE